MAVKSTVVLFSGIKRIRLWDEVNKEITCLDEDREQVKMENNQNQAANI